MRAATPARRSGPPLAEDAPREPPGANGRWRSGYKWAGGGGRGQRGSGGAREGLAGTGNRAAPGSGNAAGRAQGTRGAAGVDKTGSGCCESASPGGTRPAASRRGLRAIESPEERPGLVAWLHGVYPNSDDGDTAG